MASIQITNQNPAASGVIVKPEPSQRKGLATLRTGSAEGSPTSQYVASLEHREPMQIPSNSMPPGETGQKEGLDMFTDEPIDSESIKGIFGWETVDDTSIPYILRKQKKFVSVRIVERKLLSKYPNTFPDELGKKDPLVSYFITDAEANLLNEINTAHCDFEYGHNPFTVKDLIVDLEEFEEFFKIVKKTFPADVLSKISEEPSQPAMSTGKVDLSQVCGWIQINNTVSPYIIRCDNGKQIKLLPLSVIVYAAGLLTNSSVDGLLPTPHECAMLNEACKVAGFEFVFGKNTRLISISEVLQRCQVKLFELPFKNPLQHARYLDPCTGQPSLSPLMGHRSHPLGTTSLAQHQPQLPLRAPGSMDLLSGNPAKLNAYTPGFPQSPFHPSQLTMPGVLSGFPVGQPVFQEPPSPAMLHFLRSHTGMSLESSHIPGARPQIMTDKSIDNSNIIKQGLPGSLWPVMPRTSTPSHVNNSLNSAIVSDASPLTSGSPVTSVYQPHSLPPNPLLHSINSPPIPDFNHPIFRGPLGLPPRSLVTQSAFKDLSGGLTRLSPPVTGLSPSSPQYSISQSFPFGINQFENSPLSRTNPKDQRTISDNSMLSMLASSRQRTGGDTLKHSVRRSTNGNKSTSKPLEHIPHVISSLQPSSSCNNNHQKTDFSRVMTSLQPSSSCNNNHPKTDFSHVISACLVNGKSISCINVDLPQRKGRFCLVEAVSKLYFPSVPLTEFVKVLQVVLKVNLHECTSQEESAFVQYYNLPVNKLKCNKIIKVDDLELYFPQLSYMFSKCSSDNTQGSTDLNLSTSTAHSTATKRRSSSTASGPPIKLVQPKAENVLGILQFENDSTQNRGATSGSASGGGQAPIIVIEDE